MNRSCVVLLKRIVLGLLSGTLNFNFALSIMYIECIYSSEIHSVIYSSFHIGMLAILMYFMTEEPYVTNEGDNMKKVSLKKQLMNVLYCFVGQYIVAWVTLGKFTIDVLGDYPGFSGLGGLPFVFSSFLICVLGMNLNASCNGFTWD